VSAGVKMLGERSHHQLESAPPAQRHLSEVFEVPATRSRMLVHRGVFEHDPWAHRRVAELLKEA
jgi:hypothetical protein